ncbi:hypothetical protein ALC53_05705 [Atta colombica]|uniref:Uncharacterized protein n=1 Tax=Atta colombica TaxID=520822 RepID=A0A195BHY6_9HYME|nr:hypothetical protein ALC53_05705 [Atta colombica]
MYTYVLYFYINIYEVQEHSVQRNTKAKKHATSNVGSLKLIKPSSVIRLSCMSVASEDCGCVFTKIIRSRRSIILCEIESVLNCDLHCNAISLSLASYYWIQGLMLLQIRLLCEDFTLNCTPWILTRTHHFIADANEISTTDDSKRYRTFTTMFEGTYIYDQDI